MAGSAWGRSYDLFKEGSDALSGRGVLYDFRGALHHDRLPARRTGRNAERIRAAVDSSPTMYKRNGLVDRSFGGRLKDGPNGRHLQL